MNRICKNFVTPIQYQMYESWALKEGEEIKRQRKQIQQNNSWKCPKFLERDSHPGTGVV
jgi:hypothetical protein